MKITRRTIVVIVSTFVFFIGSNSYADLIMSAPPRESADAGKLLYEPIANHISQITGQTVIYQHPKSWLNYQKQMRDNRYDIVFDGPHFMSWRIHHSEHVPVVKLPGHLRFVIITHTNNDQIQKMDDLIGKKICGLAPPNLATLVVYAKFPNPVRQPNFIAIKGGFKKVFMALKNRKCDAAVFRDSFYQNAISEEEKKLHKNIYTSMPLPNQGITVNKARIDSQFRQKLVQSLLSDAGKTATRPLLDRFAKNAESMLATHTEEYAEHKQYIEGVIFGW
ncbi:MAG: phosphate/phosphite/phosphonate ABC transporter substrate-binding protein [Gammaproteobacteria bacterium]|nr:phosphate/phosphite/phosphonate ABC transporter substrate-binding protein [Gammaproteobacteria bacterium]